MFAVRLQINSEMNHCIIFCALRIFCVTLDEFALPCSNCALSANNRNCAETVNVMIVLLLQPNDQVTWNRLFLIRPNVWLNHIKRPPNQAIKNHKSKPNGNEVSDADKIGLKVKCWTIHLDIGRFTDSYLANSLLFFIKSIINSWSRCTSDAKIACKSR